MSEMNPSGETSRLIAQLRAGDAAARDRLIEHTEDRFRRLARRMLDGYSRLRRWEETDDLVQNALIRLNSALNTVAVESPEHFLRLGAWHMRCALFDLARHHFGPGGPAARHHSDWGGSSVTAGGVTQFAVDSAEPADLAGWTEYHAAIETLPFDEHEVVGLLWYQGLTQAEAADVLGVDVRTVKRRWQSARLHLFDALHGQRPE